MLISFSLITSKYIGYEVPMKIINAATERSTLFNVNNPNFPEREPTLFEFLK